MSPKVLANTSQTAAPVANSSGSVTNMAVQNLQGSFIQNQYGGNIVCQGPMLTFSPFVTDSHTYSLPKEYHYDAPVYSDEGDIIYYPLLNKFFEISFVEDQEPFFQLGNLPVYKLRARTWEYSSEQINTGVTDIDSAEDQYSLDQLAHQFTLEDGSGALQLENDSVDGTKNYLINEEYNIQTQSTYADNLDLDAQAGFNTEDTSDDILDFTERNPFGDEDAT